MKTRNGKKLTDSNRGYQLLRKAGWVEGTGLGAKEQGRQTPLPAWFNNGRSGIGCRKPKSQPVASKESPKVPKKSKRRRKPKTNDQDLEKERRRHEALVRLLNETETCNLDTNPLLRRNALSLTNPLL